MVGSVVFRKKTILVYQKSLSTALLTRKSKPCRLLLPIHRVLHLSHSIFLDMVNLARSFLDSIVGGGLSFPGPSNLLVG